MKIEYLKNTTNGNVIRLFDFSNAEVKELKDNLEKLVNQEIPKFPLHGHCNVNPDDNAHLVFLMAKENRGIYCQDSEFVCVSDKNSLSNMIELIDSFAKHPVEFKGHQWLDETSDISLLMSPIRPK